jgi:hypothetical protein
LGSDRIILVELKRILPETMRVLVRSSVTEDMFHEKATTNTKVHNNGSYLLSNSAAVFGIH